MNGKEQLLDTVKRSFDGDAWHGPSVREVLDGVDEETARRKLPGVHSIWELALHIAGWAGEVALRLEGKKPSEPPDGDWPKPAGAWKDAVQRVFAARDLLLGKIAALAEEDLDRRVGPHPDAPLGTGVTYAAMLLGVAQHNTYHAGQIMLLRRIFARRQG